MNKGHTRTYLPAGIVHMCIILAELGQRDEQKSLVTAIPLPDRRFSCLDRPCVPIGHHQDLRRANRISCWSQLIPTKLIWDSSRPNRHLPHGNAKGSSILR